MVDVHFRYPDGQPGESGGLNGVTWTVRDGTFAAVLGASGSGKSTLLQHLNGLLRPARGEIRVGDFRIEAGKPFREAAALRRRVGLVFQFPEQQLFAETLEQDLGFGPKNFGATDEEAREAARRALRLLGMDESLLTAGPEQLSDGQRRKAAIATVLAMDPDMLVLDEPTVSLDQASRDELMRLLHRLCKREGKTVVVVSHRLEEVIPYADECLLLERGRVRFQGPAEALLARPRLLEEAGFPLPPALRLSRLLAERFHLREPPASGRTGAEAFAERLCRLLELPAALRGREDDGPCGTG